MTVGTSSNWKSAAAAIPQTGRTLEKNLHIGGTLRDLYANDQMPNPEEPFADLLQELEAAEDAARTPARI